MGKTKITVNNNGSLRVEGDMEVFRFADAVYQKTNLFAMVHTTVILNTKQ
jgi:hypothetical protein